MIKKIVIEALNWAEVWPLLIPLFVLLFRHKQPTFLKPVIVYLWLALVLNFSGDIIIILKRHFPNWQQSNTPLYNIHSVIRFTCFSYFFITIKQPYFKTLKLILPLISLLFILIYFTFFADFFNPNNLSGALLSVEAYLLLVYCLQYYLAQLRQEDDVLTTGSVFWVVTGLSVYVVVNFFIFLFYVPMIKQNTVLAINMWNVHNIAYIFLCLFIAKAFYATDRNQFRG